MQELPKKIKRLAGAVREEGGRAMLVGGCVRDDLMGIEPKDWDAEVYGIRPERLRKLLEKLGRVDAVGEAFTVYKLGRHLDVALPRRERKTGRGHRGFVVEGDPEMTFEEAARRRDFTINAILRDPLTGEIVDPFGGRADIERGVLRVVDPETFVEDSLRVLRAAQFAARFGFDVAPETAELCRTVDVTDLPAERVWGEIEKLLLRAERPSIGLRLLYELNVVDQLFPELKALEGVPQDPYWHPEGDVRVHTLMVVDEARKLIDDLDHPRRVTVMLGALCHDLGKPLTTEMIDGRWRSLGHDEAGVAPTLSLLDRLNIHTLEGYDVRGQVVQLVRHHLRPGEFYKARKKIGDGAFRRLARQVEPDLLYRVAKADRLGRRPELADVEERFGTAPQEWFIERVRELEIERKAPEPLLLGRHLIEMGLEPSKEFGVILAAVYEMQLDGRLADLGAAKREAGRIIAEKGLG